MEKLGVASSSIRLLEKEYFTLSRSGRFLIVDLHQPHLVLSTSSSNGGQSDHLRYLVNHQSCEGAGHNGRHQDLKHLAQDEYHRLVCNEAGLPPEKTALMGTAANMQYASHHEESYREISVTAVVTAGVQGNAGRAGDPASWHEGEKSWEPLHSQPGTINAMVLFNWPLTPAALTRAAATVAEAKAAVLQELAVSSRYSAGLATGTGTDQFCLSAPFNPDQMPKTWTGKHSKLGEALARAVMGALREALRWQNGLEPSLTRSLTHALRRFGLDEDGLKKELCSRLEADDYRFVLDNFKSVIFEPQVAGCAYALAEVRDRADYGVLPQSAAQEIMLNQCALLAATLAARIGEFNRMREGLAEAQASNKGDFRSMVCAALILGWREKWK